MTHSPRFKNKPRQAAQYTRVHTGMGQVFRLLRFFGMTRTAKLLFRKKRHVADLYLNGRFLAALHVDQHGKQIRSSK